jgi:DNA polymerase-4
VSVGAGSGKQVAKIASGRAKPDGVHVVPQGGERALLDPLPVRALWGIGPVAEQTLHRAGVETVAALAALEPGEVTALLGTAVGTGLHRLARGIDDRPLVERGEAKQVSAETTFDEDLSDLGAVRTAVAELAEGAHRRLVSSHRAARTVSVKIRSASFGTTSRAETHADATTDLATLTDTAQRLAVAALPDAGVRLVGVSFSGLTTAVQEALFPGAPAAPAAPAPVADVRRSESESESESEPESEPEPRREWRTGDDVAHPEHGHGWVQGAGHRRVTVRFETATTGPGRAITFRADDPALTRADPVASLA